MVLTIQLFVMLDARNVPILCHHNVLLVCQDFSYKAIILVNLANHPAKHVLHQAHLHVYHAIIMLS